MLIEQDRSKPTAHEVILLVLIKITKCRCFHYKLILETPLASALKDEKRKGPSILFKAPQIQMCAHSSPHVQQYFTQDLSHTPDQEIEVATPFIVHTFPFLFLS